MGTFDMAIDMPHEPAARGHEIPSPLETGIPNETTAAAIEEGRRIASDDRVKGYSGMEALKAALEI